jgi:hypothetical protein
MSFKQLKEEMTNILSFDLCDTNATVTPRAPLRKNYGI